MKNRYYFTPSDNETLNIGTGASVPSTPDTLNSHTVRVIVSVPSYLCINQAATINDLYLPANISLLINLPTGGTINILGTATGKAYLTKVSIS